MRAQRDGLLLGASADTRRNRTSSTHNCRRQETSGGRGSHGRYSVMSRGVANLRSPHNWNVDR